MDNVLWDFLDPYVGRILDGGIILLSVVFVVKVFQLVGVPW